MGKIKRLLLLGGFFSLTLSVKGGFSYDEGSIKLVWKRYVGKNNFTYTCQPLIFGDKILHATYGDKLKEKDPYDKLYVFDKDGNLLWSFSSPDGGNTNLEGVVACKDYILVSSYEGYIYALSWNGKIKWKTKVGKWPLSFALYDLTGDGIPDALVGGDNFLHLLDGKTGREIWKFRTGDFIYSSPAVGDIDGDGKLEVVFGSGDTYIYALNGEDGSLLWKFKTGNKVWSSPALGDIDGDGKPEVVFGSEDNYLYVLNGEDGSLLWKFKTGKWVDSSPALGDIDGDGKPEVVFGSGDTYIYALNGEDGSLLWKFKTGDVVDSSPALGDIDGDGKLEVVFGSEDNYLYVLNGEDGSLLWKFKTGKWIASSPALGDVDGDGKIDIVVASFDGHLYRFESTKIGGKVVWSRWHGDAQGTGNYEKAIEFARENLRTVQPILCNKDEILHFKGKDYLISKGSIFITSLSGIVKEPLPYRGLDLSTATYCRPFETYTPKGLVNSLDLPTVEFVLFWNTKGREVEDIFLNGKAVKYHPHGDFVKTTPIVGNIFHLKNFSLQVRYSNGQFYSYQCYINKSLEVSCLEIPKITFPFFHKEGIK